MMNTPSSQLPGARGVAAEGVTELQLLRLHHLVQLPPAADGSGFRV